MSTAPILQRDLDAFERLRDAHAVIVSELGVTLVDVTTNRREARLEATDWGSFCHAIDSRRARRLLPLAEWWPGKRFVWRVAHKLRRRVLPAAVI